MPYSQIAIVGSTGNIGLHISNALLQNKSLKTTILTRPESLKAKKEQLDKFTAAGGKVVGVDVKDPAALTKALAGIEVVISAAAGVALLDQLPLIKAAKAAGVKRFYPSEYGIDDLTDPVDHPVIKTKADVRKAAVDAGLEVVVSFIGLFQDWIFTKFYSVDNDTSTVEIVGDGNTKFGGWTTAQIGQVVAESINHKSIASVPGKSTYIIRAHGTTNTWNEVIDAYEAVTGTKWTRKHISVEEATERAKKNPADFGTTVRIWQAKGYGKIPTNNAAEYNVKPTSYEQLFKEQLVR